MQLAMAKPTFGSVQLMVHLLIGSSCNFHSPYSVNMNGFKTNVQHFPQRGQQELRGSHSAASSQIPIAAAFPSTLLGLFLHERGCS